MVAKEKMIRCTACGSDRLSTLLESHDVPVHQNLLHSSQDAAINCKRGNLKLEHCQACGLVFNSSFDASLLDYADDYENSQHSSATFLVHMNQIADRLRHCYGLEGKKVLEIGCGKGVFLRLLTAHGGNWGKGFDPSYEGDLRPASNLQFVREFFPGSQEWWSPDLIVCRHVLEHIWQPAEFLQNLRETICDHEVPLYFEVPNVSWIFERAAFWDIFYEHCNYFSADSIERLFAAAGFGIKVIEESFAGQYLSVEVFSDKARRATMSGSSRPTTAAGFTENFGQRQRQLQAMIDSACGEGKSVAIWGAAAKGSTFLNSMQPSSAPVKFVIDINPKKQGCYIAGTGHRIVGPHHLQNDPVDIIFLMNPNYLDEVRSLLADAHCQLICI